MPPTALALVEIALEDSAEEEAFLAWWAAAEALLRARARAERATLAVEARGRYLVTVELALPGSWKIVTADRAWTDLEARRPPARVTAREARIWHREGVRDLTTSQLQRWLDERRAGTRDFVLVDALRPERFAEGHLEGAINLPADAVDEAAAAAAIGAKDRAVVVYCGSYG
jgi:hypothetical protein